MIRSDKQEPDLFSHSSAQKYMLCRRKYWHYKINRTPADSDAVTDSHAMRFGKAFHDILEKSLHGELIHERWSNITCDFLQEYRLEAQEDLINLRMCLRKYYDLHEKSKLRVVAVEEEVRSDVFRGFIDVIFVDVNGYWYICDIKTKARISNTLLQALPEDPQLNVYAYFRYIIAEKYKLDPNKFSGFRYRIAVRSNAKCAKSRTAAENEEHLEKTTRMFDIAVPFYPGRDKLQYSQYISMREKILRNTGANAFAPNYAACEAFGNPCEYWSQCHGRIFTRANERLAIHTSDTIGDLTRYVENIEEFLS
jgi:CRISPR/Cas system-associated exonuclease Cas4 (RecB family)